jgi:hypothetical protein
MVKGNEPLRSAGLKRYRPKSVQGARRSTYEALLAFPPMSCRFHAGGLHHDANPTRQRLPHPGVTRANPRSLPDDHES